METWVEEHEGKWLLMGKTSNEVEFILMEVELSLIKKSVANEQPVLQIVQHSEIKI